MPERRYYSGHEDEQKTSSSSSRTRSTSTPDTEVGEPGNHTFKYRLHYTGPVSIERAVALLAREAKDMKRSRSSHEHDRYQESQIATYPARSAGNRSYSSQPLRSQDWSHQTIRSQSHPRHSNGPDGHHESNSHHSQACLSSQGHRNSRHPSINHEHSASWSMTSDTLRDQGSNHGEAELPMVTERPLPRIERRGPDLYVVREARGRRHPQAQIPDGDPRISCRIL